MKPRKCPNCKTEIAKYWPNPLHKETQLVGRCPKCGKMVNLGKPDKETESSTRAAGAASSQQKKETGKAKEKGRQKAKHGRPAKPPAASSAAAPKRTGFRARLAEFFEYD